MDFPGRHKCVLVTLTCRTPDTHLPQSTTARSALISRLAVRLRTPRFVFRPRSSDSHSPPLSLKQTVGSVAVIDATVSNTPIFVRSSTQSTNRLLGALVLNNIHLTNVPTAVTVTNGPTVLAGSSGSTTIDSWGQGNVFTGTSQTAQFTQSNIAAPSKASSLLDSSGRIFGRTRPQYADFSVSQFVSVRDQGAKGDGKTDDTAALQAVINQFSGCKIIFVDHGTYLVTDTLNIPPGTQIVGEVWSVILGAGSKFQDQSNPHVVVRVGQDGDVGNVEISDIIFATQGPSE